MRRSGTGCRHCRRDLAAFGKPAIKNDGTSHSAFGRREERIEDARVTDAEQSSLLTIFRFRDDYFGPCIRAFHAAGGRHISIDLLGRYEERPAQIERFAAEVLPLLTDLRG